MCALRIFIILQFRTSLYWAMMGQVKPQPRLTYDKPYSVWLVWPTICFSRTMCTWMRWALAWDSVASSWRSRLTEKIPISRFANNVLGAQHVWGPRALRPAGPTVPDHARAHSIVAGAERIPCRPRLQVGLWGLDHRPSQLVGVPPKLIWSRIISSFAALVKFFSAFLTNVVCVSWGLFSFSVTREEEKLTFCLDPFPKIPHIQIFADYDF